MAVLTGARATADLRPAPASGQAPGLAPAYAASGAGPVWKIGQQICVRHCDGVRGVVPVGEVVLPDRPFHGQRVLGHVRGQ